MDLFQCNYGRELVASYIARQDLDICALRRGIFGRSNGPM